MPHEDLIDRAKHGGSYFVKEDGEYRLKTADEYMKDEGTKIGKSKKYHHFKGVKELHKVYRKSELRKNASVSDERKIKMLIDLISKVLCFDANSRLSPFEALKHPFFQDIGTDSKIDEESDEGK